MTFDQWLDKKFPGGSGPRRRDYYSDNQLTAARDAWEAATAAEREACAVLCESMQYEERNTPINCAEAISRGAKA